MKSYLSLGEAIQAFLEKNGLEDETRIQQLIMDWERLMGKPIAQQTEKIWFQKGTLYIRLHSPIWKNELQMARIKLKDMLNRELGKEMIEVVKIV